MIDDALAARAQARVGRTLKGKYRIERVLGAGGMAVVYAATHRNRNRVAVKVLHPELMVDESLRARFVREGYVANTVDHPGTVRVLDDEVDDDGSVFLVMELLEGETLDARWERNGRALPAREVAVFMRALLDVLATAHDKGIVHRDIKPENLFLTHDGTLKVLDFGIARLRDTSPSATRSGHMMGTPAFMPPEQALGRTEEVDALSDIWAVGATAFTLLSGRYVHVGRTPEEMMVCAATTPPPSILSVAPHVPREFAEVIDQALRFAKADRWQGARTMENALTHLLASDLHWSSAPGRPSDDGEDDKTKIAAPPQMTLRIDEQLDEDSTTRPAVSGPAQPALQTIGGVASRSTSRRIRSGYALAAMGGITVGLVVVGVLVRRAVGGPPTVPDLPTASAFTANSLSVTTASPPRSAASSGAPSSAAGTATKPSSAIDEAVDVETLPRAASPSPVPAAAASGARPLTPALAKSTSTTAAPASSSAASPPAADPKAKCNPPYTVDSAGVRRWKVECL